MPSPKGQKKREEERENICRQTIFLTSVLKPFFCAMKIASKIVWRLIKGKFSYLAVFSRKLS